MKNQLNLDNVQFLGHKPKKFCLKPFYNIDVGIVPLTNAKIFRGAIPSKIFEILAHKKPILLGVDGEARRLFIDDGRAGVFYTPNDEKDLAKNILLMKNNVKNNRILGENGFNYINENFNQKKILTALNDFINENI